MNHLRKLLGYATEHIGATVSDTLSELYSELNVYRV